MTKVTSIVSSIGKGVWKLALAQNCYVLDCGKWVIIDTCSRAERQKVELFLSKVVPFDKVDVVICTHLHDSHAGNIDLFPNAKLYASGAEIESLKDPEKLLKDKTVRNIVSSAKWNPVEELKLDNVEIIPTPGHTAGSVCIWLPLQKILFSGDTLFKDGPGHAHTPTGDHTALRESLVKLVNYNHKILCSGHN